jgi:hypothetical protein
MNYHRALKVKVKGPTYFKREEEARHGVILEEYNDGNDDYDDYDDYDNNGIHCSCQ